VITASLLGLFSKGIYAQETSNWATQAKGQDIGNLIAVGVLATSGILYYKGSYRAALVWVGTLLYLLYAYIVYAMAVHFNGLFLIYVAVLGLSAYALLFSVGTLRSYSIKVPARTRETAGYVLIGIGVLFSLLWLKEILPALLSGKVPQSVTEAGLWVNPIHVIDLSVVLPAFIMTGIMTLKNTSNGLFFMGPWLVFSALMGASIVAAMLLMTFDGVSNTIPPMIMVSTVVMSSFAAAVVYLKQIR